MKMSMTRVQAMMQHPDPKTMLNLSMQASKDLSQTLQACGIKSIRLASVETMGGSELKPVETTFFDGVPPEISKWVVPAVDGIASFMSAFGISSISFEADRRDMAELGRSWSYIVNDETQLNQVKTVGVVVPQAAPEGIEDRGVGTDPGPKWDGTHCNELRCPVGPQGPAGAPVEVGPLSHVIDESSLPGTPFGGQGARPEDAQTPKESEPAENGSELVEI